MDSQLAHAAELPENGNIEAAREAVIALIEEDKTNFEAWQALSQLAKDDQQRRHAIYNMWGLRPDDPEINTLLDKLKRGFLPPLDSTNNDFSSRNYYKKKAD